MQRVEIFEGATTIEGMLRSIQGHAHGFLFVPTEMEESHLVYKLKKNNSS
jgi:hypothetical protein